jgi:predicted TIM-barrel enzyme
MAIKFSRKEIVARLNEVAARGVIFEAAVGSGISAKWSEAGGADLIATYNIAKYRMMGYSRVGYFPIGDANQIVLDLGKREILPQIKNVPVIAGVFGADPTRDMSTFLDEVAAAGFSGVLNCPTLALLDGNFRKGIEKSGFGYQKEIDMIAVAHGKDLFTQAFVTDEEEARKMVAAGVDLVIGHLGGTLGQRKPGPPDSASGRKAEKDLLRRPQRPQRCFAGMPRRAGGLPGGPGGGEIPGA